jgi:hypothetical protein
VELLHLLQRHALPIKAHLRASLVLTYAFPAEVLTPLLGPGLRLDTYGNYGFLAVALVETSDLRPSFAPSGLGLDFFLTGYRIFARYQTLSGRNLRGLRILRSDTDRLLMKVFGNALTHYGYEHSHSESRRSNATYAVTVRSQKGDADLQVEADISADAVSPPPGSPFPDLREARKFAGPLPFTFDYERQTHSIIRIEGVRQQWNPRPVSVTVHQNTFLEQERFRSATAVLANAFFLESVPYAWKPGIREPLP